MYLYLFYTCMTIATSTSLGFIERLYFDEFSIFVLGNHHLGNTLTIINDKVGLREVDEQNHDLASIIGINRAGGIKNSNAMFQCQPTARTYLCLEACWQSHEKDL